MPNEIYITCPEMHTFRVLPGSEAAARYDKSKCVTRFECPECLDNDREYFRSHARTCECLDELCQPECAYVKDMNDVGDPMSGLEYLPVQEKQ